MNNMAKQPENVDRGLNQLKSDLKTGAFSKAYAFYGEERYLLDYYLAALKKALVSGPMEDFNFRRLNSENFSLDALRDAISAPAMMAEYVLVQVEDYDLTGQNAETSTALAEILSDLPEGCCVVFVYDTVAYKRTSKHEALAAAIRKNIFEVKFAKRTGKELSDWIARHFRKLGKTITPDLCQYLVFRTGGMMTVLASEIEKIAAYSAADAIVRADIDAVTDPALSAAVFDVIDALAENNSGVALSKLRELFQMDEEPIALLAALGSHFRKVHTAKVLLGCGKGADALMELIGTKSEYYAGKLLSQARRVSEEFCRHAVEACYRADCGMKRSFDDGEAIVETLILDLAQEVRK